jgi:hypothetical protein
LRSGAWRIYSPKRMKHKTGAGRRRGGACVRPSWKYKEQRGLLGRDNPVPGILKIVIFIYVKLYFFQ